MRLRAAIRAMTQSAHSAPRPSSAASAVSLQPLLCFAALLLLALLGSLSPSQATERDCQTSVSGAVPAPPRLEWPAPYLAHTNRTAFDALGCALTFADFVDAHSRWFSCYHASSVNVVTCPAGCASGLMAMGALGGVSDASAFGSNGSVHGSARGSDASGPASSASVYGSYPYHASSSICLAAVHAGVIADELGGGLFIDRFYPMDWSNTSTQSIWPHMSAVSTLSYGVQSLDVPAHLLDPSPTPLDHASWTVRARGITATQRQLAPFPPRAGHTHAWLYPQLQQRANWSTGRPPGWETYRYNLHFVVGGHNDTHYLNDVWLFHSLTAAPWDDTAQLDRHNARNGRWYRLPDAPFTPRAHMAHHAFTYPDDINFFDHSTTPPATRIIFLFFGGEVSYACGNRVLGHCSSEVWQLNSRRSSNASDPLVVSDLGLRFDWEMAASGNRSEAPLRFPFSPRCGFAPIFERRGYISKQSRVTGIAGGQLSYEDETCQAPIVTVNEAWYGRWPYEQFAWTRGMDAPFSARRSMVVDDAIVSEDDQLRVYANLDKTVTLVGGIRYLEHRYDSALNQSITTKAEVYADAWSCTVWPMWIQGSQNVDCDWHYSFPFAAQKHSAMPDYAPSGSVPLPIAHSTSALHPIGGYLINMRIGGVTSREALRAWSTTPLPAAEHTDAGVGYGGGVGYSGGVGAVYGQSVAPPHSSSLSISSSPSSSTSSYSTSTSPTSTSPTSPTSSSPSSPSHAHSSNVSLLVQPSGYRSRQLRSTGGSTLDEVMASRYRLPMAWPVDEAELNDPTSSFHMGSDEVVSHTMPYLWVQVKTQLTMLGDGQARGTTMAASTSTSSTLATSTSPTATQPAAAAAAAASPSSTTTPLTHASTALTPPSIPLIPSSSSTPLTISSSSTPLTLSPPPPPPPLLTDGSRRRSFDFRAGRLEHAMASTWNTAIVSGGRQGQAYSNDWLTYEPSFCLWPEDPSYADELGPVRFVYRDDPDWSGHAYYLSAAAAAALASSAAAHHHTITLASHHITSTSHHTMSRYHTRTHP